MLVLSCLVLVCNRGKDIYISHSLKFCITSQGFVCVWLFDGWKATLSDSLFGVLCLTKYTKQATTKQQAMQEFLKGMAELNHCIEGNLRRGSIGKSKDKTHYKDVKEDSLNNTEEWWNRVVDVVDKMVWTEAQSRTLNPDGHIWQKFSWYACDR